MRYFILIFAVFLAASLAAGQSWTPQSPAKFSWVRDLAINNSGGTLYAADNQHLMKLTGSSTTWSETQSPVRGARAVVCKYDQAETVLVSANGLLRSTNGGSLWAGAIYDNPPPTNPTCIAAFKAAGHRSYMVLGRKSTTGNYPIYYSANSGANWSNSTFNPGATMVFHLEPYPIDDATYGGYVWAGTDRGLYSSADHGVNWGAAQATSYNISAVAVRPSGGTPYTLYIGTTTGKIYRSVNNGSTWQVLATLPGISTTDTVRALVVFGSSPTYIYAATDNGFYRSLDDGVSFTRITSGMLDFDLLSLVKDPVDNAKLTAGSIGFIYRSIDAGITWTQMSGGLSKWSVSSVAAYGSNLWTVMRSLPVSSKYDGANWQDCRISSLTETFSGYDNMRHPTTTNLFAVGSASNKQAIYQSNDGGLSYFRHSQAELYQPTTTGTYASGIISDPKLSSRVYAFGKLKAKIGTSTLSKNWFYNGNSGADGSWSTNVMLIGDPSYYSVNAMACMGDGSQGTPSQTVFAGLTSKGIYKSPDAGTSWSPVGATYPGSTKDIFALAANINVPTVLYAGAENGLWKTTNALDPPGSVSFGTTALRTDTIHSILIDPRYAASSDYVFVAARASGQTTDKLYYTTNGGASWLDKSGTLPTPVRISELVCNPPTTIYVVSDSGIYYLQLPLAPLLTSPSNGASVTWCPSPVLDWEPVTDVHCYRIQVATNSSFSPTVKDTQLCGDTTQYNFFLSACGTTYYWRVSVVDGFGEPFWTSAWSFTADAPPSIAPILSSPANGATGIIQCSPTTFTWTLNTCSESMYKFQLSSTSNFSTVVKDTTTSLLTYTLPAGIMGCAQTYYWRVAGVNCVGRIGAYSSVYSLTTSGCSAPSAPTLTSPPNGQTNAENPPLFQWTNVNTAFYQLQVAKDAGFTQLDINDSGFTGTSRRPFTLLRSGTLFYWRVRGINCGGEIGAWSASFTFTTGSDVTVSQQVLNGWNFVSVPDSVSCFLMNCLWPTRTANVFLWAGSWVVAQDPMVLGRGYETKFDGDQTITYTGRPIYDAWMDVTTGWNIVGSISKSVLTSTISSDPPSIIISAWYDINNNPTTVVNPGSSAWVKVSQNGRLHLTATPPKVSIRNNPFASMDKFTVTDKSAQPRTLYVEFGGERRESPPSLPAPRFSACFTSGNLVENIEPTQKLSAFPIQVSNAEYPITISWDIQGRNDVQYRLSASGAKGGKVLDAGTGSITFYNAEDNRFLLEARTNQQPVIPLTYNLEQNYPNPFNPTTAFQYGLPENGLVKLVVYDVLGQEIATLVDEYKNAGSYSVKFDASNLSSGIYFYRLTSGKFTDIKKMLLLR